MYIIAMITMLIDHIGVVFAPEQQTWRIIGRMAMPIYAYCLVVGYRHTRSKSRYFKRLVLIAVVSEIPFVLAMQSIKVNIVGTFLVCFIALLAIERIKNKFAVSVVLGLSILLLEVVPFDYGAYALMLVLAYYYLNSHTLVVTHFILNLAYLFHKGWLLQLYSILPTMVLVYWPSLFEQLDRFKVKRWIWRSFYPVHLAVLGIIVIVVEGW
jgi:hypothetical protein